jgi:hypothetical protein
MDETAVREAVRSLAPEPDVPAALLGVRTRHRRGMRRRRAIVGLACVATVGALMAGVLVADHEESGERVHTSDQGLRQVQSVEWRTESAPMPMLEAEVEATAWTGEEAIWLLTSTPGDGATTVGWAYRPEDERWRELPPMPIEPRQGAAIVWTGDELVVWGGLDATVGMPAAGAAYPVDGAAYDPVEDEWRVITEAPIEPRSDAGAVWTGEEVVVFGGTRHDGPPECPDLDTCRDQGLFGVPLPNRDAEAAAYDPQADAWRTIPDAPGVLGDVQASAWDDGEARFVGTTDDAPGLPGWALATEDEQWRALPTADPELGWRAAAAGPGTIVTNPTRGQQAEAWFGVLTGTALAWIEQRVPLSSGVCSGLHDAAPIGEHILLAGCPTGLLDPTDGSFTPLPEPPAWGGSGAISTGNEVLSLAIDPEAEETSLVVATLVKRSPSATISTSTTSTTAPGQATAPMPQEPIVTEPNPMRPGEQLWASGASGCTTSSVLLTGADGTIVEDVFEQGTAGGTYIFEVDDLVQPGWYEITIYCPGVVPPLQATVRVEPGAPRAEYMPGAPGRAPGTRPDG